MNNNYKVVLIAAACFLVICLYGKFRCNNPDYHDPLMNKLGVLDLDGWSLSHFGFFTLLGYLYPDTFVVSMSLGIGWEAFEHILGKNRPGILGGFGDCMTTDPGIQGSWWFGRVSDIVMNLLGFIFGAWLNGRVTIIA